MGVTADELATRTAITAVASTATLLQKVNSAGRLYEALTKAQLKTDMSLDNVSNVAVDDTAYNATSWNANADAATKNAARDKFVTVDSELDLRCLESVFGTSIGAGLLLDSTTLKASAVLQKYHAIDPSADVQSLLGSANDAAFLVDLGVSSTAAELNILDGVTASTAELNYLDITTLGTAQASKALTIAAGSTWTVAGMTCADLGIVTTVDINGGTLDGVALGATCTQAEWDAANTHIGESGASHTHIDQSVVSGANVTFGTIGCGAITSTGLLGVTAAGNAASFRNTTDATDHQVAVFYGGLGSTQTPANDDTGHISLYSINDNDDDVEISKIEWLITSITDDEEYGKMIFSVLDDASMDNHLEITHLGVTVLGSISVTGTVDGIDIATDVAANTTHRGDNSQAHTDYLVNNASDSTSGTLTADQLVASTTTVGEGVVGGSAYIGNWQNDATDAVFCHTDQKAVAGGYAIYQNSAGKTIYNSAAGQIMVFNQGGAEAFQVNANGHIITHTGSNLYMRYGCYIAERAAAVADLATYGQLWIKNDAPNILMFTDDAGNDYTVDVTAV